MQPIDPLQNLAAKRVFTEANKEVYDLMQASTSGNVAKVQNISEKILNKMQALSNMDKDNLGVKMISVDLLQLKQYLAENKTPDNLLIKKMVQSIVDDLSHIHLTNDPAKYEKAAEDPHAIILATSIKFLQQTKPKDKAEEKQLQETMAGLERMFIDRMKFSSLLEDIPENKVPAVRDLLFERSNLEKELKITEDPRQALYLHMKIQNLNTFVEIEKTQAVSNAFMADIQSMLDEEMRRMSGGINFYGV